MDKDKIDSSQDQKQDKEAVSGLATSNQQCTWGN